MSILRIADKRQKQSRAIPNVFGVIVGLLRAVKYVVSGVFNMFPPVWQKRLKIFVVANIISYFFVTELFFGFWDTTGNVCDNVKERFVHAQVKRQYGDTLATARQAVRPFADLGDYFSSSTKDVVNFTKQAFGG